MTQIAQIIVVAAITDATSATPRCVVRWALGNSGRELPQPDDVFDVTLAVDGSTVHQQSVSPMNYVMLDPSRRRAPDLYPNEREPWSVVNVPQGPIEPLDADSEDLAGKAVGIIHLLGPTAPPRLRFRIARVLYRAFAAASQGRCELAAISRDKWVDAAVRFADLLVHSRIRPRHLPSLLVREYRELQRGSAAVLLDTKGAKLTPSEYVALVMSAVAFPGVVSRLEQVAEHSNNVREHIRLAGLQGGSMVDYWSDPFNQGKPVEEERGRTWPASEMVGCGCRIDLAPAQLKAWATGKHPLSVTVKHRTRSGKTDFNSLVAEEFRSVQDIWLAADTRSWGSATSDELSPARMVMALKYGSSHPPLPPTSSRVDWGMVRVDLERLKDSATGKDVPTEPSMSFRTGDSRIEICIDRPPPPTLKIKGGSDPKDERTGAAYNVYGVWEGLPQFQAYFDDPNKTPTLAELRPWLLTKRYSYAKDLKPAFPDINGAAHPSLQSLIDSPCWHPLLKRPDVMENESDVDTTSVPDVGGIGDAVFVFDLRAGMALPASVRAPKGWDPGAPLAMSWRPELDRELAKVKGGRPQRYRFWVTAVDAFEQESEPCPVATEDCDLGEAASTIFEPRRRSPLGPAPGGGAIGCRYDESTKTLMINFETPFERQVSDQPGSGIPSVRVASSELDATVVMFRRLLLPQPPEALALRAHAVALPPLPQWQQLEAELVRDRWCAWNISTISASSKDDLWSKTFQLEDDDLGWEYRFAVSFGIKSSRRGFWAKLAVGARGQGLRSVTLVKAVNGKYPEPSLQPIELMPETPADSPVVLSNGCVVGDPKLPWWPDITASQFTPARPITAPPGIRRDLILQRLIGRAYVDGNQPVDKQQWGGEELTKGQVAMCVAALDRTRANDASIPQADAPELAMLRWMLARDFRSTDVGRLRQHASIGFRGVARIDWKYRPRSVRNSATKCAEAAAFRVYGVAGPLDPMESANYATATGGAAPISMGSVRYKVIPKKGGEAEWLTVKQRPTLAVLRGRVGISWASVTKVEPDAGCYILDLKPKDGALPAGPVDIHLFAAQPLADVPSGGFDHETFHSFHAPAPGGVAAMFVWWVTGVSAAGKESLLSGIAPAQWQELERSVEPPPVSQLSVRPGNKSPDFMDPIQCAKWMPAVVDSLEDAQKYPRVVLSWQAPPEHFPLEIRRIEEQIARPTAKVASSVRSAWDAINTIEGLRDQSPIQLGDLDALKGWLTGKQVAVPDLPTKFWTVFQPPGTFNTDGVMKIDEQSLLDSVVQSTTGPESRPAWIDYFGRNEDTISAMDANWRFRYQLCTYIDLGPKAGAQRWLYSTPTPWSESVIPDRPPIKVLTGTLAPRQTQAHKARVVFDLHALLTPQLRAERLAVNDVTWEYRVVVRRRLPSSGLIDGPQPWIDIGKPVRLRISDSLRSSGEVVDDDVDRSWPGHRPEFVYRIFVQEFMELHDAEGQHVSERLVRAYETDQIADILIRLEAPTSEQEEIEMRQRIEIF